VKKKYIAMRHRLAAKVHTETRDIDGSSVEVKVYPATNSDWGQGSYGNALHDCDDKVAECAICAETPGWDVEP
jgi:hypothetical protein